VSPSLISLALFTFRAMSILSIPLSNRHVRCTSLISFCLCDSDFMKVARRLTIIERGVGRLQKPLIEYMVERA
jgi:hypothetical protein